MLPELARPALSRKAVLLFQGGQCASHACSPDSFVRLPEAISIDRIGILLYLPALGRRQYSILPDDPGVGEQLTQALGDAGRDWAKTILRHVGVHYLVSYGGAEFEHREVLQHKKINHVCPPGYGRAQGMVTSDPVQLLSGSQLYPDRADGPDAQGRKLLLYAREFEFHVGLGAYRRRGAPLAKGNRRAGRIGRHATQSAGRLPRVPVAELLAGQSDPAARGHGLAADRARVPSEDASGRREGEQPIAADDMTGVCRHEGGPRQARTGIVVGRAPNMIIMIAWSTTHPPLPLTYNRYERGSRTRSASDSDESTFTAARIPGHRAYRAGP